jgi:hypothetical protein
LNYRIGKSNGAWAKVVAIQVVTGCQILDILDGRVKNFVNRVNIRYKMKIIVMNDCFLNKKDVRTSIFDRD